MTRIRFRLFVLTCFVMFFAAFPTSVLAAPARKPILEMIPKEVAGFVVLSDLSRTDEAAATLATKTELPIPGPLMVLKMATGIGDAIDAEGSIAAVYFTAVYFVDEQDKVKEAKVKPAEKAVKKEAEEEETEEEWEEEIVEFDNEEVLPNGVFLLPISDFETLLKSFKKPKKVEEGLYKVSVASNAMLLTSKDGYALLTPEKNRKSLDRVLKSKNSVAKDLEPCKKWIDEQVVYTFLMPNLLKSHLISKTGVMFGTDIEIAGPTTEKVEPSKEAEEPESPEEEKASKKPPLGEVVNYVAAGMKVDKAGVTRATFRASVKPDTQLSQALQGIKPSTGNFLASFPQGPFVFAGGGPLPDSFINLSDPFSVKTSPSKVKAKASLGSMPDYQFFRKSISDQVLIFVFPEDEGTLLDGFYTISWAADPEKSFDCIQKDLKGVQGWLKEIEEGLEELLNMPLGGPAEEEEKIEEEKEGKDEKKKKEPLFKISTKETTIDGCKALVVTYDLTKVFEKLEGHMIGAQLSTMLEKAYCKDKRIDEYNIQLDKHRILSTFCNDLEVQKKLIKAAKAQAGGLADDADVKKILAMLPAKSQWRYVWSPCGTSKFILSQIF